MKNFLKTIFLLVGVLICVEVANEQIAKNIQKQTVTNDTIKGDAHIVCATMYYAVPSQCDDSPLITADGSKIDPKRATEQKLIAVSRDLLKVFKYGDLVEIIGTGKKDGIYRVADTMNKRIKNTIDILETNGTPLYKFKNVTIKKILT